MTLARSRTTRLVTAAAAVVALGGVAAGCSTRDSTAPGMPGTSSSSSAPATSAPAGPGAPTPASGPHDDADVMFAQMMVPHHRQAVEMSTMLLAKKGIATDVTTLAQQIKDAQDPEITRMTGWLTGWGAPTSMPMDHGTGGVDDGMMSQADMDTLDQASGTDAARLYLTGMTKHHRGAIAMAETELDDGQNQDAKELAQQIIDTQQAEITTMDELLATL